MFRTGTTVFILKDWRRFPKTSVFDAHWLEKNIKTIRVVENHQLLVIPSSTYRKKRKLIFAKNVYESVNGNLFVLYFISSTFIRVTFRNFPRILVYTSFFYLSRLSQPWCSISVLYSTTVHKLNSCDISYFDILLF